MEIELTNEAFVLACASNDIITAKELIRTNKINTRTMDDALLKCIDLENFDTADWLVAISYLTGFEPFTFDRVHTNSYTTTVIRWVATTNDILKKENGRRLYLKFIRADLKHYDHQYDLGKNVLKGEFDSSSTKCCSGGFYVANQVDILDYIEYGPNLCEINLPLLDPTFQMKRIDWFGGTIWRVNMLELVTIHPLQDATTFDFVNKFEINVKHLWNYSTLAKNFARYQSISGYKWLKSKIDKDIMIEIINKEFLYCMPNLLFKEFINAMTYDGVFDINDLIKFNFLIFYRFTLELVVEEKIEIGSINEINIQTLFNIVCGLDDEPTLELLIKMMMMPKYVALGIDIQKCYREIFSHFSLIEKLKKLIRISKRNNFSFIDINTDFRESIKRKQILIAELLIKEYGSNIDIHTDEDAALLDQIHSDDPNAVAWLIELSKNPKFGPYSEKTILQIYAQQRMFSDKMMDVLKPLFEMLN